MQGAREGNAAEILSDSRQKQQRLHICRTIDERDLDATDLDATDLHARPIYPQCDSGYGSAVKRVNHRRESQPLSIYR